MDRLLIGVAALAAAPICGCMTPWNTRFPDLIPRSTQYEQAQAEVQDPYPDADIGPETGFRPLGYTEQRSEQVIAKDRAGAAFLRQQYGQPGGGIAPGPNGSLYPDAVPY
jgi:hypothetical protein